MMNIESLKAWIGREQRQDDAVSGTQARRMAALLDQEEQDWRPGDTLPAHWYPMLFGETARQSSLGADGHPQKGGFLPPVPLPRRMFAGRRVQFRQALHIGEVVCKRSKIHAIMPKEGRSGSMCFVTVRHEIAGENGVAVVEEQDIVYREAASRSVAVEQGAPVSAQPQAGRIVVPDSPMLFRYSAITFNAHRIHYDLDYTRSVEGYPSLVVNGGLALLLLWDHVVRAGLPLRESVSRNLKPLYAGRALNLDVEQRAGSRVAVARDEAGEIAIEAAIAGEAS